LLSPTHKPKPHVAAVHPLEHNMKPFQYRATIVRVIDGDSIEVDIDLGFWVFLKKQNVRLFRIDSPESRTRDLIEKQFGILTKTVVESFCPVGSTVLLETDLRDHDKFGRILGRVEVIRNGEPIILNDYLLENRLAVDYEGQNKSDIEAAHLANREYLLENGKIELDPDFGK